MSPDASAAAAVAAIFFAAAVCCGPNFVLTGRGFHLYIPLGIAAAVRGVAYTARASFFVRPNPNLLALYGALNAVGLGITVAICCCFFIIWLRNAAHYQSPAAARVLIVAGKLLVVAVIAVGPVLGVVAAIITLGARNVPPSHGANIRTASAAGFLAVCCLSTAIVANLAATWLFRSRKAAATAAATSTATAAAPAARQDEQSSSTSLKQQQRADSLIFVLLAAIALLTWCAAVKVASVEHPHITATAHIYYPASVLPELLVAVLWAVPLLAARVALGGRYDAWLEERQQVGTAAGSVGIMGAESGTLSPNGLKLTGKGGQ